MINTVSTLGTEVVADCIFQKWPQQYFHSHRLFQSLRDFVNLLLNRMQWKWHYVTLRLDYKRQCSFHPALSPGYEKTQLSLYGSTIQRSARGPQPTDSINPQVSEQVSNDSIPSTPGLPAKVPDRHCEAEKSLPYCSLSKFLILRMWIVNAYFLPLSFGMRS